MDEAGKKVVQSLASVIGSLSDTLVKAITVHAPMTHTAIVVTGAAILEAELERCIKTKLRPLSSSMDEKLFEYPGPLSTSSAKIDMAYALDITNEETHQELGRIRKIRNNFSHSTAILTLNSEEVRPFFAGLTTPGTAADPRTVFMASIEKINDYLERYLIRMGVTENISDKNKHMAESKKFHNR